MINTFDEAREILEGYMPLPRVLRPANTLSSMNGLMQLLGNPQEAHRVIHVAGTSGKTSTAYYIASMLKQTGKKVGLTVSPHIREMNERTQINLVPLEEARFCELFSAFMSKVATLEVKPTYFELLVAFAFWVFAEEKVDYAVIEVGIGGLLDATNVVSRHDKVCVITDIGLDHTETLGQTLTEIASHKAGIVKPNNKVFVYEQGDDVMSVVREVCDQQQAELHEIWPLNDKELPQNLPLFQRRNWYLALAVSNYIVERDGLNTLDESQLAISSQTYIPARMEILKRQGKTVVLDGAHNSQKIEVLAKSLKERFPESTFVVVFGLVKSKNTRLKGSVLPITDFADHLIITSYDVGLSTRRKSASPAKVAETSHLLGYDDWEIIAEPYDAYRAALKRPEDIVVVTGSFFMIDQLTTLLYRRTKAKS